LVTFSCTKKNLATLFATGKKVLKLSAGQAEQKSVELKDRFLFICGFVPRCRNSHTLSCSPQCFHSKIIAITSYFKSRRKKGFLLRVQKVFVKIFKLTSASAENEHAGTC
jgi:hypothetical protein